VLLNPVDVLADSSVDRREGRYTSTGAVDDNIDTPRGDTGHDNISKTIITIQSATTITLPSRTSTVRLLLSITYHVQTA